MGVLAVYGYGLPEIVDAQNTELNQIFREVSLTKTTIELGSVVFSSTRKCDRISHRIERTSITNTRILSCRMPTRLGRWIFQDVEIELFVMLLSSSRDESVRINYQWNIDRFLAYVTSWSGYVRYMEKYPDKDVIADLRQEYGPDDAFFSIDSLVLLI